MRCTILRMLSGVVTLVLGIALTAFIRVPEQVSVPPIPIPVNVARHWRSVTTDSCSFSVPPTMQQHEVMGSHGTISIFQGSSIELTVPDGTHPDDLTYWVEQPSYTEEVVWIDGREAKVCSFRLDDQSAAHSPEQGRYIAAVHFSDLKNEFQTKLTLWASCASEREQEIAKQVFRTIIIK